MNPRRLALRLVFGWAALSLSARPPRLAPSSAPSASAATSLAGPAMAPRPDRRDPGTPEFPAAAPVRGAFPWISLLCQFSDDASEPTPITYYQGLLPKLDAYFREISYQQVNLAGSGVAGWFRLPQPRSYYLYPSDNTSGDDADWVRLGHDCTAAADASVDFRGYAGISIIYQVAEQQVLALGGGLNLDLDGRNQFWRMTWLPSVSLATHPPSQVIDESTVEHELGHALGLPHSSSIYEGTYDNAWDVMSFSGFGCNTVPERPEIYYGCPGQHTIAYHKDLLGWIPAGRKLQVTQGVTQTVTLDYLESSAGSHIQLLVIPVAPGLSRYYTLEAPPPPPPSPLGTRPVAAR